jgi:CRP-like cAMP-binding protein
MSISLCNAGASSYDARHMGDNGPMTADLDEVLRRTTIFRRLSVEDRQRLAEVSRVRTLEKGDLLFRQGDPSEVLYTVVSGRVKVFKSTARGADLILEIFGPGDPVGAVAVYESRPYPATAAALEPTTCLLIPRPAFFSLLERHPSLVKGLLTGLTHRLVELTNRLAELSTGRVDARLARFFLKLADTLGQPTPEGTFIPLALSRQELADMIGTTIETAIRIMSRWGKDSLVRTDRDGFLIRDRGALEYIAFS